MNAAAKFLIFFFSIFLICGIWHAFNDFALQPYNEAMDNQTSINAHPYPLLDDLFNFVWGISFILAIISLAFYLAGQERLRGGMY